MKFPGQHVGYIRSGRWRISISAQRQALAPLNCINIWIETKDWRNEHLKLALMDCRKGDILVMTRDAYFAISKKFRREMFRSLLKQETGFNIVGTEINSNGPHGELVVKTLLQGLDAHFKAHSEVVKQGLLRAAKEGRKGGRPKALSEENRELAQMWIDMGGTI